MTNRDFTTHSSFIPLTGSERLGLTSGMSHVLPRVAKQLLHPTRRKGCEGAVAAQEASLQQVSVFSPTYVRVFHDWVHKSTTEAGRATKIACFCTLSLPMRGERC